MHPSDPMHGRNAPQERVRDRMRVSFISVTPADHLLQVAQLMQLARIRHLPVLDPMGGLLGIVSHRDVLEASAPPAEGLSAAERWEALRAVRVADVMRLPVHTVEPDATLRDAAEQMLRFKIGCLPVVEPPPHADAPAGVLLGLLTESDLLAAAYLPELDARTLTSLPASP